MGQKVNPTSLRLHTENKHFDSCWFSEKQYAHSIHKDLNVETYYNAVLKQIQYPSASFFLEAAPRKCKVSIVFLNPAQLREQAFKQFDSANSRNRKTKQSTLFSTKKERTPFYGLSKKRGGVLELFPSSLFTPSFLQNLENREFFLDLLFSVFDPVKNTKKTLFSLENGKRDEKRNQKKEDRTPSLLREIENQSFSSSPHRPPQEGDLALKKQGMEVVDRQTDLHNKALVRREAYAFGEEARKTVWSSLVGLAISRYFVERKRSENLLSATSRFLLLQAFFCFLNLQKKGDSSDVLVDVPSFLKKEAPPWDKGEHLALRKQDAFLAKTKVELREEQKDTHPFLYKSGVQDLQGGFAKERTRQEDGLSPNLQKSSIYAYHIESIISNRLKSSCKISFFRAQNVAQNALFVVEEIVYQLERRNTFRQIKSKFLQELGNRPAIKGVRVTCVGRIGGRAKKAQRARGESFKMGQTSLHLFNSKVSFASKTALTPFGAVGVKVWVCWK